MSEFLFPLARPTEGCTHPVVGLEFEAGYVVVQRDNYDVVWRVDERVPVVVTLNGWLRCQVCGQLTSVETDEFELGNAFSVRPESS